MIDFMALCLEQARLASPHCRPNPAVGAVVVDQSGNVLGVGRTQTVGQAHAEIMALRQARSLGHDVAGATMYVTLEPCAHHGRTGPCAEALIQAGIRKVIAAVKDPNPLVAGRGFSLLRSAGIEVVVGPNATEALEINKGFFSRFTRQRPWVRLKVAASLDGKTALMNGESQWITGEAARRDGHQWRARSSAILTGIGTILRDNPLLDCKGLGGIQEPLLAIVDSTLRTPPDAKLFSIQRTVFIFATTPNAPRQAALEAQGAKVIYLQSAGNAQSRVNLAKVLETLAQQQVNDLHVEAGTTLNGALLQANLVDELITYLAPTIVGPGSAIADMDALKSLTESKKFRFVSAERVGDDLRIIARATDVMSLV